MLLYKREFAYVFKLRILRWADYPGFWGLWAGLLRQRYRNVRDRKWSVRLEASEAGVLYLGNGLKALQPRNADSL